MTTPVREAMAAFAAELARWRVERGLSKKQLARLMGFDASYVSHIEALRHRPTAAFARRAENVLLSDDRSIWREFLRYEYWRRASARRAQPSAGPLAHYTLVVEEEVTTLSYDRGSYSCSVTHRLVNRGRRRVTRHIVQVYTEGILDIGARKSASFLRDELQFHASLGSDHYEPIEWALPDGGDTLDEVLLLFKTADIPVPLYSDERTMLMFGYRLPEQRQIPQFERDVRTPTLLLRIRLDFPSELEPTAWGEQTSFAKEDALPDPSIDSVGRAGRVEFEWQIENPMLLTHFRFGWRFNCNRK